MKECEGRLVERERRGLSSDADRLALDAHLSSCEACRLTLEMSRAFAHVGTARDDAAMIARLAQATLSAYEEQPAFVEEGPPEMGPMGPVPEPRGRLMLYLPRLPKVRLLLVALAFSTVAMGGVWGWSAYESDSDQGEKTETSVATNTSSKATVTARAPRGPANSDSAESSKRPESVLPPRDVGDLPSSLTSSSASPSSSVSPVKVRPPSVSASDLFKAANDSRRRGERSDALSKYRALQSQFPGSAEATLSRVSLGGLLLEQGAAGEALVQFDGYLKRGTDQRLTAEALFGRGRALGALGQKEQETKNWRRLLSSYPDSPYAGTARQRLDTLTDPSRKSNVTSTQSRASQSAGVH